MNELTCTQVRDAAAEYALGILPPAEQAEVARHLLTCDECRAEVQDLAEVGTDLLGLVPDAEPPLGFDRRVLAHVQRPRRRRSVMTWATSGVVAAAAAAAVLVAVFHGSSPHHHEVVATLVSDGRSVGSVYTAGHPLWLEMDVKDPGVSGPVRCYVVKPGGQLVWLGSFDLVDGGGDWGAPLGQIGTVRGVQLEAGGRVIATATFNS